MNNERRSVIRSIQWLDDAVVIEFMTPIDDLKANGIVLNHTIVVPAGDDYDDELESLTDAAHYLLVDVLEDLPRLDPPQVPDEDDNDNED